MSGVEVDNFSDPEEDPEEEIEEDSEEDHEKYENEETDEQKLELKNPIDVIDESRNEIGVVNNERASEQHKHRETSRKRRKSRWENPQSDDSSKKRQTRWDEQGPQNGLLNHLVLSIDPNTVALRMKLMEINQKLQSSKFHDERPAGERSPSPQPVHNSLGIRINTREARMKMKLMDERKNILSKLAEILTIGYDPDKKFVKKLLIPQEEYPDYNFMGLILGPKGTTLKKMEKETRARIFIRGRGSGDPNSEDEKLHVLVEASEKKRLDSAVAMIEKLLIPMEDEENHHKQAQLSLLAKMRGNYKDNNNNTCELCKEPGHRKYACPLQDSTFKATCCDLCGSFAHTTSNCDARGLPQFCRDKSNKDVDPTNLYVSFLPASVDDKRLREIFLPFGSIVRARVVKHEANGLSKGFGFVKFENASDAADAIKYMNGNKMDGRILTVRVAGLRAGPHPAIQTSCSYNSPVESYMLPQAPLCAAPFPGYSADVAKIEVLNVPSYFVSSSTTEPKGTGNDSSDYDFCDRIPSLVPNTVTQFPGDPDYCTGSEFGQYFSSPVSNEAQYQTGTQRKSNFWGGSDFFL